MPRKKKVGRPKGSTKKKAGRPAKKTTAKKTVKRGAKKGVKRVASVAKCDMKKEFTRSFESAYKIAEGFAPTKKSIKDLEKIFVLSNGWVLKQVGKKGQKYFIKVKVSAVAGKRVRTGAKKMSVYKCVGEKFNGKQVYTVRGYAKKKATKKKTTKKKTTKRKTTKRKTTVKKTTRKRSPGRPKTKKSKKK